MNFAEIFNIIPQIIQMFVPGFVVLLVTRFFLNTKQYGFDHDVINSLLISYLINLFTSSIALYVKIVDSNREITSILISVLAALVCVKIKNSNRYKNLLVKLGFITGNPDIWRDIIDINKGTRIRFYTKYNNDEVMVTGNVKYFNVLENDCDLALENYRITFFDNDRIDKIYSPCEDEGIDAIYYVNTRDINGVELTYGQ